MTQPRPTADELIDAVRAFLADDLLPTLEGRQRFHARVAVNVLDIVGRELRDGQAADDDERSSLVNLLAVDDAVDDVDTSDLARLLAEAIRRGDIAIDDPSLLDHLRRTADADLRIANPRHAPTD
jgi:Domain of unknown function (DUF6285)